MIVRFLTLTIAIAAISTKAICQNPPEEFIKALSLITTNRAEAKTLLFIAAKKSPDYFGSYNFLGIVYTNQHQPDSAIFYYKKSLSLNSANVNHTKELTYLRLINEYTYKKDFKNAFDTGLQASNQYPDNQNIVAAVRDACLWSFYIDVNSLPADYLSADAKDEYIANTITQEYLIVRWLKLNDNALAVASQSLVNKNNSSYDVLKCQSRDNQSITVNFKINWDMNKEFGGKPIATDAIINNKAKPAYERIGAMLHANGKTDVKAEAAKLVQ